MGQEVLLKRTFGDNPKISVKWKEDATGAPYIIMKRIGPVNYVIRNSVGAEKVYHRNMLKAAGSVKKSQFSASPQLSNIVQTDIRAPTTTVVIQRASSSAPIATRQVDRSAFSQNVLGSGAGTSAGTPLPSIPSTPQLVPQNTAPLTSRYGREYKPVSRLIDEVTRT